MLRLTPFRETTSVQEVLKEDRVELLSSHIQVKFDLSPELMESLMNDLQKLDLVTLKILVKQILRIDTFEQLELWIADHTPEQTNTDQS